MFIHLEITLSKEIRFFSLSSSYWLKWFNLLLFSSFLSLPAEQIFSLSRVINSSNYRTNTIHLIMMRKIRFRYIKENGKSTSVTVRCSLKRKLPMFLLFQLVQLRIFAVSYFDRLVWTNVCLLVHHQTHIRLPPRDLIENVKTLLIHFVSQLEW